MSPHDSEAEVGVTSGDDTCSLPNSAGKPNSRNGWGPTCVPVHMENRPAPQGPEGCLTVAIRIPVRIVVLVLVVPVRIVWDLLAVGAKALRRVVLAPLWRGLVVIPFGWLYRWVLTPLGRSTAWLARGVGAVVAAVGEAFGTAVAWVLVTLIAAPSAWLYRQVLTPLARIAGRTIKALALGLARALWAVFVWPPVTLWRLLLSPLWRYGILLPASWLLRTLKIAAAWLYRAALTPTGHALARLAALIGAGLVAVGRGGVALGVLLVAVPVAWLYRWVLAPLGRGIVAAVRGIGYAIGRLAALIGAGFRALGRGIAALGVALVEVPAVWLYRWVLTPLGRGLVVAGREIGHAIGHAWRVAGHLSRAIGRGLKWLARTLVGRPTRWVYVVILTPVGHAVRDAVWRPAARAAREAGRAARQALASARETVRAARQEAWRALVGGSPRERTGDRARTLGSTTTASGAVPAPEISLSKAEG
ncbi:hypothetical protein ACFYNY_01950 [Streptomyces sp. NPDC006530]|uniref:hypothetical protein n=1 Tax=Streptomyces sp. NPDC006530 TaxID=3364750 RepID=UPI0036A3FC7C